MAGKLQADRRFKQQAPVETSVDVKESDDIDVLVSGFLQELSGISTETTQPPQQKATEAHARSESQIEQQRAQELPLISSSDNIELKSEPPEPIVESEPEPMELQEEICLESGLDLDAINREIEETLGELDRQKPVVIPVTFQKEAPKPASPPPVKSQAHPPPAANRPSSKRAPVQSVRRSEDQDWMKLDIFRAEVVNSRSARRRKYILIAMAGVVLLGILIYLLIYQRDQVLNLIGQYSPAQRDPLVRALNPETQFERTLPGFISCGLFTAIFKW